MTITASAINSLPLGKDVYGDITNCFQDWRAAACDAIFSTPEPTDDTANTQWWIAILGNMAWAATVMFPPAFAVVGVAEVAAEAGLVIATGAREEATITRAVVAGASAATQAVSFLGAAAGSGVVAKVNEYQGKIKADGKDYIRHYVLSQIPRLQSAYVDVADDWAKRDLLNHLISLAGLAKHQRSGSYDLTDEDFLDYYKSAKGADQRYRTVWEDLVFPNFLTTFDRGQEGLEDFFSRELKVAFQQFEDQWNAYTAEAARNFSGVGRYLQLTPFVPRLTYPGLPTHLNLAAQNLHRSRVGTATNGRSDAQFYPPYSTPILPYGLSAAHNK